jgi:Ca-activated chloride channel family protein
MTIKLNLLFLFLLLTSNLFSNGIGIIDGSSGIYLQALETKTKIKVKDQIAIVTNTQVFKNTTGSEVNIKYGFPLNPNANPTSLRWKYNGVWKTAIVNSAVQDNSIPSGTGGGSVDQALSKYLGEFPFFFSPQDEILDDSLITIELTFVELLPYFNGEVSYFQKNDFSAIQNEIVIKQSLEFILESEKEVLDIELLGLDYDLFEDNNITILSFSMDEHVGDFDYHIDYELSSDALGINSLSTYIVDSIFSCDDSGSGYFTFIIEPESNVDTDVIEKNFSLIIDRSGSMSGEKIVQAKDAASYIVKNLNPGDYFNIIDFSSSVTSFADDLVEYNVENETDALAYIDEISASGSTNISETLISAINQFSAAEEDKANIIIFCTDGQATAGETNTNKILELVEAEISSTETEVFLFTLGIGASLDQALLTLLARENNGLVQFIDPENLESDLVKFFLSVNNPVLLSTMITIEPDIIKEIYPYPYPNLYKGQQLILSGRYDEIEDLNIKLEGKAFNVPVTYNFQVALSDTTNNNLSFLPKIWAKQKLDVLGLDYYLTQTEFEQDSISNLIDLLSTCYGVIAIEFSSFDDGTGTTEVDEIIHTVVDGGVQVYPSPFYDHLTIEIEELKDITSEANLKLFNLNAQLIKKYNIKLQNGRLFIDGLEMLDRGVYYLIIEVEGRQYVVKITK